MSMGRNRYLKVQVGIGELLYYHYSCFRFFFCLVMNLFYFGVKTTTMEDVQISDISVSLAAILSIDNEAYNWRF